MGNCCTSAAEDVNDDTVALSTPAVVAQGKVGKASSELAAPAKNKDFEGKNGLSELGADSSTDVSSVINQQLEACHYDYASDKGCPHGRPVAPHGLPHDVLACGPPRAPNEDQRQLTSQALGLDRAAPCPELDVLLRAVCKVFEAPYSSVALYVDGHCWLCNTVVMPKGDLQWRFSACPWNLLVKQPQTLVCGDMADDARFADMPYVQGGLRCYVSSPLLASNGHRLGTICFLDDHPRTVNAGECRLLNNFAELAVRVVEQHVKLQERLNSARSNARHESTSGHCITSKESAGALHSHASALTSGAMPGIQSLDAADATEALTLTGRSSVQQLDSASGQRGSGPKGQVYSSCITSAAKADQQLNNSRTQLDGPAQQGPLMPLASSGGFMHGPADAQHNFLLHASNQYSIPLDGMPHAYSGQKQQENAASETGMSGSCRPEDVLLSNVFARQLRHPNAVDDSCVLLLDTSKPGWPVVYCNRSWELWTGSNRDSIIGQALNMIIRPASSKKRVNWDVLQRDVSLGAQFVLTRMQATYHDQHPDSPSLGFTSKSASTGNSGAFSESELSVTTDASRRQFDISFRPAALDLLDEDTLPLGMPSFIPMQVTEDSARYYAARLHRTNFDVPEKPLSYNSKVSGARVHAGPHAVVPQYIAGVQLHQVLGRGGYGTVYHATWHDTEAVVKVQDYKLENRQERRDAELEISLGQRFNHPNLVRTYMHASVGVEDNYAQLKAEPPTTCETSEAWLSDAFSTSGSLVNDWRSKLPAGILLPPAISTSTFTRSTDNGISTLTSRSSWKLSSRHSSHANGSNNSGVVSVVGTAGIELVPVAEESAATAAAAAEEAAATATAAAAPVTLAADDIEAHETATRDEGQHASATDADVPSQPLQQRSADPEAQDNSDSSEDTIEYPCHIRTFMVLEFCDKGSLQDAIDRGWLRTATSQLATIDLKKLFLTALDIAQGMQVLHDAGVVHADLTANNVLLKSPPPLAKSLLGPLPGVERPFIAKVADFGKSRLLGAQEYIQTESYGTISHMAPEVLSNGILSKAADVYAFSILLWQMYTGSRPWAGMSHLQIMVTVMKGTITLQYPDHTPPALKDLGCRCMARQAADRPSFVAIAAELERLAPALC